MKKIDRFWDLINQTNNAELIELSKIAKKSYDTAVQNLDYNYDCICQRCGIIMSNDDRSLIEISYLLDVLSDVDDSDPITEETKRDINICMYLLIKHDEEGTYCPTCIDELNLETIEYFNNISEGDIQKGLHNKHEFVREYFYKIWEVKRK